MIKIITGEIYKVQLTRLYYNGEVEVVFVEVRADTKYEAVSKATNKTVFASLGKPYCIEVGDATLLSPLERLALQAE